MLYIFDTHRPCLDLRAAFLKAPFLGGSHGKLQGRCDKIEEAISTILDRPLSHLSARPDRSPNPRTDKTNGVGVSRTLCLEPPIPTGWASLFREGKL